MKKKVLSVTLLLILVGIVASACTTGASTSTSWPGFSIDGDQAILSYGPQIYALNVENGNKVWTYPAEAQRDVAFYAPAEIAEGLVIQGDYADTLYAINQKNGVLEWTFDGASDGYIASALLEEGFVYAPNADKKLYVLDSDGSLEWIFQTEGPNWSKPVSNGEFVFLASMDHYVYALKSNYDTSELVIDNEGRKVLVENAEWKTDLGTAIVSDPLFDGESLYVGTIAGKLFKLNTQSGAIEWTFDTNGEGKSIWTSPLLNEGALYFGTENGLIFSIDPETGNEIWTSPYTVDSQIIASGINLPTGVGFGTSDGSLVTLGADQSVSPVISREGGIYTTPAYVDGRLFLIVVGGDKLIYVLDENGREFWTFSLEK